MNETLIDLFTAHATERPDHRAIVTTAEELTFRRFSELTAAVADELRRAGAGPDVGVGVFANPSVDLMAGVWGTLRAGAAYLPLAPEYPEHRLRHMLAETGTRIVFAPDELRARVADMLPADTRVITVSDISPGISDEIRPIGLTPDNLAYFVYTSGSTGTPRGVMVDHRAIVNQMHWLRQDCGIDETAVVLQKTPASFDAAQWEILAPACGSRVVAGPGGRTDPGRLVDTVVSNGVTALQCVPTLLRALLATGRMSECTSLTTIFSGGETLDADLAENCAKTTPWCRVVNLYGPSECTINSAAFTMDARVPHPSVSAN